MKYIIISEKNKQVFITKINKHLSEGYLLYGDTFISNNGRYTQAMYKINK